MVRFIQQEASEKASEIKLKADEEFNIEKLRMVEAEKQKIRQEYERKEKQVEVQKRMYAAARQPASPPPVPPPPARRRGWRRETRANLQCGRGEGGVADELRPCACVPAVLSPMRSDTRG